jgi:hypothetical protein
LQRSDWAPARHSAATAAAEHRRNVCALIDRVIVLHEPQRHNGAAMLYDAPAFPASDLTACAIGSRLHTHPMGGIVRATVVAGLTLVFCGSAGGACAQTAPASPLAAPGAGRNTPGIVFRF